MCVTSAIPKVKVFFFSFLFFLFTGSPNKKKSCFHLFTIYFFKKISFFCLLLQGCLVHHNKSRNSAALLAGQLISAGATGTYKYVYIVLSKFPDGSQDV
jgi:hypothetical protein